jgi:uncharacterized protein
LNDIRISGAIGSSTNPPEKIMGEALEITKQGYAAFGRRDIPALLKLVADEVEWQEACPASLPYSGLRRNPAEVGEFFAAVDQAEDITVFEVREFIEADENVTAIGYYEATARDTKQRFQSEWVHVLTVQNGKITRCRGFYNTAARYGH